MRTRVLRIIALLVVLLGFLSPVSSQTHSGLDDCTSTPGSTSCGG